MTGDDQGSHAEDVACRAIQQCTYADGRRCDELGYLQCKLILKPDRFTLGPRLQGISPASCSAPPRRPASAYRHTPKSQQRPEVREVLFLDTGDFHLYNNAFIVRRRIAYEDGFPVGDPEIVFKYRSADMMIGAGDRRAAATSTASTRSSSSSRSCRSRSASAACAGCSRTMSSSASARRREAERLVMSSLGHMSLPELQQSSRRSTRSPATGPTDVALVNQIIVEELLQDICELDFGHHTAATANLGLWRSRGDHHSFVGEFAFQLRFDGPDGISPKALQRLRALLPRAAAGFRRLAGAHRPPRPARSTD